MQTKITRKKIYSIILIPLLLFVFTVPAFATTRQNNCPIVLVNGFAGWDRNDMLGYKYWGGFVDLQKEMTNSGYTTYTAAVAPFSSNWDRACELYATIKGGTVDYGKAHSEKHKHARYGRTFTALYPEWSKDNKIHLVAHSMGAQTVRMLAQLLENGSAEEKAVSTTDLNPLFNGGSSWILSITTIAGANDGTTLADAGKLISYAKSFLVSVSSLAGLGDSYVYDFKFDQWGLKRQANESVFSYNSRVWNSELWNDTKDLSTWDLSTDGAQQLNSWVKAQPDIYYFSWATNDTTRSFFTGNQIPTLSMTWPLVPLGFYLGSYTRYEAGRPIIDSAWLPNDGVVNTISTMGPKLGSSDKIETYNGTAKVGVWNYMGVLANTDHEECIGNLKNMTSWYKELAANLGALQN